MTRSSPLSTSMLKNSKALLEIVEGNPYQTTLYGAETVVVDSVLVALILVLTIAIFVVCFYFDY